MDEITATAALDLWTAIVIGWYDEQDGKTILHTTEDDYSYDNIEDAAISVLPTIAEWINSNY